jgi:hypothetical protein
MLPVLDDGHPDFFIIVGYLVSPKRRTKLDIETPIKNRTETEARYLQLSGEILNQGTNYIVLQPGANKWSSELRIYFIKNQNIPIALSNHVVPARFQNGLYNARVNDNNFIWDLIRYGFEASDRQNPRRIQSLIPLAKIPDYTKGYNL